MANRRKNYQGLAITALLTTPSGFFTDFMKLPTADQTPENAKKLLRHSLYFKESAIKDATFNPKEPDQPEEAVDAAINLVKFGNLVEHRNAFKAAHANLHDVVRDLLDYDGGSCPMAREQPGLFRTLDAFGASAFEGPE